MSLICLGSIYEHLTAVALRVEQSIQRDQLCVWIDQGGNVLADDPELAPASLAANMIGTYKRTSPLENIESALRAVLRERAGDQIPDGQTHNAKTAP
jgi:hypothetical protein